MFSRTGDVVGSVAVVGRSGEASFVPGGCASKTDSRIGREFSESKG